MLSVGGGISLQIRGTCCTVMMSLKRGYPSPAGRGLRAPGQDRIHYQVMGTQQGE